MDLERRKRGENIEEWEEEEEMSIAFGMPISAKWKLIGECFIYLEGVGNLVETSNDWTPIFDKSGRECGAIRYSMWLMMPKGTDQNELKKYADVSELRGKKMRVHFSLHEASGLPEQYSLNCFCK